MFVLFGPRNDNKQIGQQLNLSPRTVEDHLNAAKINSTATVEVS